MNWKKSDWYIPPDWLFQLSLPALSLIALVVAGVLLPVENYLHNGDPFKLFCAGLETACFGVLLLVIARWPLYQQRQFLSFGPGRLPKLHRKIYWLAYAVLICAVLQLGVAWLRAS